MLTILYFSFLLLAFQGYLDHFSRALHLEYSNRGIFVQSLLPFQVDSLTSLRLTSVMEPSSTLLEGVLRCCMF